MNRIDPDTDEAIRRFLALISSRYELAGAIVYGSRARGTHRPDSDMDVAVLLRGEHQRFLTAKLDMADVAFDVLLDTGAPVAPDIGRTHSGLISAFGSHLVKNGPSSNFPSAISSAPASCASITAANSPTLPPRL